MYSFPWLSWLKSITTVTWLVILPVLIEKRGGLIQYAREWTDVTGQLYSKSLMILVLLYTIVYIYCCVQMCIVV